MRGVIAYPWPFLDHWNPIALYPLIVLPSPHTRLALMVPPPFFVYVRVRVRCVVRVRACRPVLCVTHQLCRSPDRGKRDAI